MSTFTSLPEELQFRYKPEIRMGYIKKLRDEIYGWYVNKDFRRTQFGWLHRSWIEEGIKTGAIAIPDKYKPSEIIALYKKIEYEEDVFDGRKRKHKKTIMYDTVAFDNWIRKVDSYRNLEDIVFKFPNRLWKKIQYIFGR